MSFFSSVSVGFDDEDGSEQEYVPEPWEGPPSHVLGGVVPIERLVVQNANAVIALSHAGVFEAGVLFHVQISARRGDMDEDRWWELEQAFWGHSRPRRKGMELPDSIRRFGVRFPDGSKAVAIGDDPFPPPQSEPTPPVLVFSGGGGGSGSGDSVESNDELWLWPLPPAEPIEFLVEWPIAGVPLTAVELDGAALAAAASKARPYWP
ncbi:hypothetical protein [Thermomonospora umbrina]|uniref:Uncharacterized protein n=1 Tax=Thermomonospora umbrina TaxID=111806 RepID=A0A3D9T2W9_9ACTN|nr:hypothetical protein [Thermomonospora umbrina]REF00714.1 hypothetical protein DFJ69_6283 [Thermomonospora umbrina]